MERPGAAGWWTTFGWRLLLLAGVTAGTARRLGVIWAVGMIAAIVLATGLSYTRQVLRARQVRRVAAREGRALWYANLLWEADGRAWDEAKNVGWLLFQRAGVWVEATPEALRVEPDRWARRAGMLTGEFPWSRIQRVRAKALGHAMPNRALSLRRRHRVDLDLGDRLVALIIDDPRDLLSTIGRYRSTAVDRPGKGSHSPRRRR